MDADRSSWFSEYPEYTFNEYSRYLKRKYGESVYRVSVDAGFSCPHRDSSPDRAGCSFCGEGGARAPYLGASGSLWSQIRASIDFLKNRYGARKYMLYFQAFSNTYGSPARLKTLYDEGLGSADFEELIISTRPDCIDEKKADLLHSYSERGYTVWVELGLQSASQATLDRIRRGHTVEAFCEAYAMLKARSLNVAVHVIFGLPGEGLTEITRTMAFLARLSPDGVKIHNLHIPKNTALADEYRAGELVTPGSGRHMEYVIGALEALPKETLVFRLTCDTRQEALLSPRRFCDKAAFFSSVRNGMRARNTWQGKYYLPGTDLA